jgi:hypothetical protein
LLILITNNTLDHRAGSELYVRDLAIGLLKRGHTPIAYSTQLGDVAGDIRAATIPVIDDLDSLTIKPDIIHGQHHLETMTALLRFPGVPAVSFCHGWMPWEELPPKFPRIFQYVAVDHTCRDRLVLECGITSDRVRVLLNFVDLERFKPRGPLPVRPQRALVFSNSANEHTHVPAVREACARHGISLDIIGVSAGSPSNRPEEILGDYDIVFAKARAALEGLAVGAAVVMCDATGSGPMVTTNELDRLRSLNFGVRLLRDPVNPDVLEQQIARYDADDAARVSQLVRKHAGRDAAVDQIISLYGEVIAESQTTTVDPDEEMRAASDYVRWLAPALKRAYSIENRAAAAELRAQYMSAELAKLLAQGVEENHQTQPASAESNTGEEQFKQQLALSEQAVVALAVKAESRAQELDELTQRSAQKEHELDSIASSLRETQSELDKIKGSFGWRLLNRYGPIKYRFVLPAYETIGRAFRSKSGNGGDPAGSPLADVNQASRAELSSSRGLNPPNAMEEVFSGIYHRRTWGADCESVSGPGSSLERTSAFRDDIVMLFKEINIRILLDAGCGDFNWMRLLTNDLDMYTGLDIVPELISENQARYGNNKQAFFHVDITRDKLSCADLILSRDCLVHLSFQDIFKAIKNFKDSGSTYLLATTFIGLDRNIDIPTGGWRQLNLQISPFNFPAPIRLIDERRQLSEVTFADKHLALWALRDIQL